MTHKSSFANKMPFASDLLPHSKNALQILQERAKFLAENKNQEVKIKKTQQYIKVRIDKTKYGIPFQYATKVVSQINFTYIPCAEKYIIGTINHRGKLIAIIDLATLFYQQAPNVKKEGTLVIVSVDSMTLGIKVDEIIGSESFAKQQLEAASNVKNNFILGIHQGTIAILNLAAVINHIKLRNKGENP